MATGNIGVYDSLWGPGIQHANYCVNRAASCHGEVPYTKLTNKDHVFKNELIFGQKCYYHLPKVKRDNVWDVHGAEAIWVGISDTVSNGHIVVPSVY